MSIADADDWYEELMNAHRGLTEDQSVRLNCALVLLLANRIADLEQLTPLPRRGTCGRARGQRERQ